MKTTLFALMLVATTAAPAFADSRDERGGHWNGNGGRSAPQAQAPAQAPAQPRVQAQPQFQAHSQWQGGGFNRAAPQTFTPQANAAPAGGWTNQRYQRQAVPAAPQANAQAYQENAQGYRNAGGQAWRGGQSAPQGSVPQGYAPQSAPRNGQYAANSGGHWQRGADGNWQRGGDRTDRRGGDRTDRRDWDRGDRRDWDRGAHWDGHWDRDWRRDNRYNWYAWRGYNPGYFRVGAYYDPFGYGYFGFGIGSYIDAGYYAEDYWIADPYYYHLPVAYPGTRWVRYYNDVLLIDINTGEVIDVINNFFL